jgi:hypothetical protein
MTTSALVAHRERVHGVGEVRAEERGDALALEEALHHDRLGPSAAVDLGEATLVAHRRRWRRERDHLPTTGHRSEYNLALDPEPSGREVPMEKFEYFSGTPEVGIVPRAPHAGPLVRHVFEQEHGRGGFAGKVTHT